MCEQLFFCPSGQECIKEKGEEKEIGRKEGNKN